MLLLDEFKKKRNKLLLNKKMIADGNYDDMTLQPGDDREFKNQFSEFLKQNYQKKKTLNYT